MDIGNILSPVPTGFMMDWFGRKTTIAALGPMYTATWMLPLMVNQVWALYLARFLAGIGKGIAYTAVPIFLGEIAEVKIRGALSSVFAIQQCGGVLFETIIGSYVTYTNLNIISVTVPVLFFIMFIWVPESPYFLLKKGRRDEAAQCLRWYKSGDDSELQEMEQTVKNDMQNKGTYLELLSNPKNLTAISIIATANIAQRAGGVSCLLAYSSLMLPEPAPIGQKSDYIILFGVLLTAISFVGMALVDKIGRKPLLILSEVSLGVFMFINGLYFYIRCYTADMTNYNWIPYLCYESYAFMFAMGLGFVPVVFLGEMLPVNVRSHGSALMSIVLAFSSFVSNKSFLFLSYGYGFYVMFFVFAAVNFICALLAYLFSFETKGKTFAEIQSILKKH
ncbi:facilitated trehalose transporter Tret1-2 homolog isoform X2 [Adelges cooleyi]|nr:facilitated trehalose transporter Tret1-2 homolog isoform X2 [Adelges cooleyi]